jgi:hypothetical protein
MKNINFIKFVLILVSLLFLHLATAIVSAQQPAADAQVAFHVA